jgi:hypothetical protein
LSERRREIQIRAEKSDQPVLEATTAQPDSKQLLARRRQNKKALFTISLQHQVLVASLPSSAGVIGQF